MYCECLYRAESRDLSIGVSNSRMCCRALQSTCRRRRASRASTVRLQICGPYCGRPVCMRRLRRCAFPRVRPMYPYQVRAASESRSTLRRGFSAERCRCFPGGRARNHIERRRWREVCRRGLLRCRVCGMTRLHRVRQYAGPRLCAVEEMCGCGNAGCLCQCRCGCISKICGG